MAQIISQMDPIIDNDWYLMSWNGKPTEWGKWNPSYINSFPPNVGDRRLNSTLILTFLQQADRYSGYYLDLDINAQAEPSAPFQAVFAAVDITPEVADRRYDANGDSQYVAGWPMPCKVLTALVR